MIPAGSVTVIVETNSLDLEDTSLVLEEAKTVRERDLTKAVPEGMVTVTVESDLTGNQVETVVP